MFSIWLLRISSQIYLKYTKLKKKCEISLDELLKFKVLQEIYHKIKLIGIIIIIIVIITRIKNIYGSLKCNSKLFE